MAKKGNRILIKLVNPKTGTFYVKSKNRINTKERKLDLKKYDPKTRKHEKFEEKKL